MFDDIIGGWKLLKESIRALTKYPLLLTPIFFCWIVVAAIILSVRYYVDFPDSVPIVLAFCYLVVFAVTMTVCIANVMMLEFVEQIESGRKVSFTRAAKEAFVLDFFKMIPLAAIWAAIWFITLVIEALLSSKKSRNRRPEPSLRDAARTLGGAESGPFSWLSLGLSMFRKLVRMWVFMALPAITWENKGPFAAFKQSTKIMTRHPMQFLTAYTLTGIAAIIMAIPLIAVFIADEGGTHFSDVLWAAVIFYEGIVWTTMIYLEQMSTGLLYLWHLKWEKSGSEGEITSVAKPDLLDDIYELEAAEQA